MNLPTKKQYELLDFIDNFIKKKGYSPSYREMMNGLGYTSSATVALHVKNLLGKGYLSYRERAARSLEVVHKSQNEDNQWLVKKVSDIFNDAENTPSPDVKKLDALVIALDALDLENTAQHFKARLYDITKAAR